MLILCAPVNAADVVPVYYEERTPYAVTSVDGRVTGLTATPVTEAFNGAEIGFEWKKMPFKRQLQTIKYNKKKACGIGWFKKPEREEFAIFSAPIYQDKPSITISKQGNTSVAKHKNAEDLLKEKNLKLLVKDGFSYGTYIDELIERHNPKRVVAVGSSNLQMLQMIMSGRADYFFVSEEEAEEIITSADYSLQDFQRQRYMDMPPGNKRYIACSQQITQEIVDRLNVEIKE
jgi:uncharacterized protein (TIGR02285 family)